VTEIGVVGVMSVPKRMIKKELLKNLKKIKCVEVSYSKPTDPIRRDIGTYDIAFDIYTAEDVITQGKLYDYIECWSTWKSYAVINDKDELQQLPKELFEELANSTKFIVAD
jgi:hypothetical protein